MTILNAALFADRAAIITDSAAWYADDGFQPALDDPSAVFKQEASSPEHAFAGHITKVVALPHVNAIVAAAGDMKFWTTAQPYLATLAQEDAEDALGDLPALLAKRCQAWERETGRRTQSGVVMVGYSYRQGRAIGRTFFRDYGFSGVDLPERFAFQPPLSQQRPESAAVLQRMHAADHRQAAQMLVEGARLQRSSYLAGEYVDSFTCGSQAQVGVVSETGINIFSTRLE